MFDKSQTNYYPVIVYQQGQSRSRQRKKFYFTEKSSAEPQSYKKKYRKKKVRYPVHNLESQNSMDDNAEHQNLDQNLPPQIRQMRTALMNRRSQKPPQNFIADSNSLNEERQFIEESEELRDYVLASSNQSVRKITDRQELNFTQSNFSSIVGSSPQNFDRPQQDVFSTVNPKKPRMLTAKNYSGHTSLKQRMIQTYHQYSNIPTQKSECNIFARTNQKLKPFSQKSEGVKSTNAYPSRVMRNSQIASQSSDMSQDGELEHMPTDFGIQANEQVISVPQFLKALNGFKPKSQSTLNTSFSKNYTSNMPSRQQAQFDNKNQTLRDCKAANKSEKSFTGVRLRKPMISKSSHGPQQLSEGLQYNIEAKRQTMAVAESRQNQVEAEAASSISTIMTIQYPEQLPLHLK